MMTWTMLRQVRRATLVCFPLVLGGALVAGCGALDVTDPTAVEDADVSNATGADLLRRDAVRVLYLALSNGAYTSGVLADEFWELASDHLLDNRRSELYEAQSIGSAVGTNVYRDWQEVRRAASLALPKVQAFTPADARAAAIGEMLAVRGFATLRLAEDICPGFPLHDVVNFQPVFGPPRSTVQAFEQALADLDSALAYVADSARILHFAQVGQGRALLGLERFTEAAEAVVDVPTGYLWNAEYNSGFTPGQWNSIGYNFGFAVGTFGISDEEGGTGLDFVGADDPRLPTELITTSWPTQEGVTRPVYASLAKYPNLGAPMVLASGLEARLIEAEAALQAGDPSWLDILNELRATQITPAMPALADPGTFDAQVDLLFRERAFWLFGTGHRLADLRRLITHYGRDSESVFPTGTTWLDEPYGTATSIPFPAALEQPHNPAVTGCTSR